MLSDEMARLLVHARHIMETPYITINERSFYIMLACEAFLVIKNGELEPKDFRSFKIDGKMYYIAEVTL